MNKNTFRQTQSLAWYIVAHGEDTAVIPEVVAELERAVEYWAPKRDTMEQAILARLDRQPRGEYLSLEALAASILGISESEARRATSYPETQDEEVERMARAFNLARIHLYATDQIKHRGHRGYYRGEDPDGERVGRDRGL